MLSEDLALTLHSFDHAVLEIMERECRWMDVAGACVVRNNLADILDRLREMERSCAPAAPVVEDGTVVRMPRRRPRLVAPPPDGGDAA